MNTIPKLTKEDLVFYKENDVELVLEHYKDSVFLTTILHEVFGHGSGKMFRKDKDGKFNYPHVDVFCPFTGEELYDQHYEEGETFESKFGEYAYLIDECRCEGIGLYLASYYEIQEICFPNLHWDDQ